MTSATQIRPIGRVWWLATQRLWRQNTILLPAWAAFVAVFAYRVAWPPGERRPLYLSALAACAMVTALLAPVQLHAASILESRRFELLPLTPVLLFLLRPVFGNPFRLLLIAPVWAGAAAAVLKIAAGPPRASLELVQLTGWTLAGLVAAEIIEEILRRRPSVVLHGAVMILLATSVSVLAEFGQIGPSLAAGAVAVPHGLPSAMLLGARAALGWEAVAAGASLATLGMLLAIGTTLAERFTERRPRLSSALTMAAPIGALSRRLAPRAPASFAKELAHTLRVLVFWVNHAWVFAACAIALASGNPGLLVAAFALWIIGGYNILGPDVPMGGLVRYVLLPRSLERVLAVRHAAILASGAITALAALLFVTAVGGLRGPVDGVAAVTYLLWFAYGASLFLIFTLTGSWFSTRQPRSIGLRSGVQHDAGAGTLSGAVLLLVAIAVTLAGSMALVIGWSAALAVLPIARAAPRPFLLALLLTSLTQYGIYAFHHRTRFHG